MDDADFRSPRDERRQAMVAIASDVFMEEGYAATSMSAIAARLGGSKGTLYNYFRSKAALFTAVVEELHDGSMGRMAPSRQAQDAAASGP